MFRFLRVSNRPSSICYILHEVIAKWSIDFLCVAEKCRVSLMWVDVMLKKVLAMSAMSVLLRNIGRWASVS